MPRENKLSCFHSSSRSLDLQAAMPTTKYFRQLECLPFCYPSLSFIPSISLLFCSVLVLRVWLHYCSFLSKRKKILNLISGVIWGAKYSAYVVMMIYAYEQGCSEAQMAVALSKWRELQASSLFSILHQPFSQLHRGRPQATGSWDSTSAPCFLWPPQHSSTWPTMSSFTCRILHQIMLDNLTTCTIVCKL